MNPSQASPDPTLSDVIKIAILAVGGQGGGVLTNWIADLAAKGGYDVQTTSVAGVAQRTGATVYYIEMAPKSDRRPVFAQSPAPGDVDIMIAAELAEAGRAVLRGFVTPDRTTLIASTHRILAVSEKMVPGDGRSDVDILAQDIQKSALRSVCFDMDSIALQSKSVISSSLFGALAKSRTLPFDPSLYEEVIRASGRGVDQSLAAFRAALKYEEIQTVSPPASPKKEMPSVTGPAPLIAAWEDLSKRVNAIAPPARDIARAGLRKVVDYQDIAYGAEYLDHLFAWQAKDDEHHEFKLTQTAAKYIANAMCYDDIIRVADLKTRASRNTRLRAEQGLSQDEIAEVTEFSSPRGRNLRRPTRPTGRLVFCQTQSLCPPRSAGQSRAANSHRPSAGIPLVALNWDSKTLPPRALSPSRGASAPVKTFGHCRRICEGRLRIGRGNFGLSAVG